MRGEEVPVLRAFRRVKTTSPGALLLLAPRHAERFDEAEHLARGEGFAAVTRSALPIDAEPRADVVVLDTIGELAQLYQLATVVFVGGSLVETGGHNILEPAVFGRPIVFGPHMHELRGDRRRVPRERRRGAGAVGARARGALLVALLSDPVRRAGLGAAARALVDANRGAKDQDACDAIGRLLPPGRPAPRSARSAWCIECRGRDPLSLLYAASRPCPAAPVLRGTAGTPPPARAAGHQRRQPLRRRQREDADRRAAVAACCTPQGERPAMLTRGYGRADVTDGVVVVSDGEVMCADLARAGDEPLMLARSLPGVVVIVAPIATSRAGSPSGGSAATSTCSTTGFSTCSWRATSTCCSRATRRSIVPRCCPRAGCASRSMRHDLPMRCSWTGPAATPVPRPSGWGCWCAFDVRRTPGRLHGAPFGDARPPAGARIVAMAASRGRARSSTACARAGFEVVGGADAGRDHHRFIARDLDRVRAVVPTSARAASC